MLLTVAAAKLPSRTKAYPHNRVKKSILHAAKLMSSLPCRTHDLDSVSRPIQTCIRPMFMMALACSLFRQNCRCARIIRTKMTADIHSHQEMVRLSRLEPTDKCVQGQRHWQSGRPVSFQSKRLAWQSITDSRRLYICAVHPVTMRRLRRMMLRCVGHQTRSGFELVCSRLELAQRWEP